MRKIFGLLLILLSSRVFPSAAPPIDASPSLPDSSCRHSTVRSMSSPPSEKKPPVSIPRFPHRPVIDGKLEDEIWRFAARLTDFYQVEPGENVAPSRATEVLLGYDDKHFYVAFRAFDEPGKVHYTVAKRDDIWNDDNVGMFIDTFDDKRNAYAIFFNPLGVQADGLVTGEVEEDYSPDIVMESKGIITETGYTVESAIPFTSLRYEAGRGKLWGAHFFRRIKRFENELDSWMPLSRDQPNWFVQQGYLIWLDNLPTSRNIEIIPAFTIQESGRRVQVSTSVTKPDDPGLFGLTRFVNEPVKVDPGLTAKLGVTPATALVVALNPDFAQVEADQPVITANQRFPIFFQEKRPIFLEGAEIFQTPLQAVHTRAIIDPDYAIKLSSKHGPHNIGVMLASDNAPGNFNEEERADNVGRADIQRLFDKNAFIGIVRLQRDLGERSSLGLISTSYSFVNLHNHVAGVDGRFQLDRNTKFSFQVLGTFSRMPFSDQTLGGEVYRTGNGFGYFWMIDKSGRNIGVTLRGEGRTRDYRAQVGFTERVGTNAKELSLRYTSAPAPNSRLILWKISNLTRTNFDWSGRLQILSNDVGAELSFRHQITASVGYIRTKERIFEEEFGFKRTADRPGAFFGHSERSTVTSTPYISIKIQPDKKYMAAANVDRAWNALDFDLGAPPRFPRVSPPALTNSAAPLDPGVGRAWKIDASGEYKPTSVLRILVNYTKSSLKRSDSGRIAFDDNVYSFRTTYQFTRFAFVRARFDYSTLTLRTQGQYLFGWTPRPGTSVYLGYNDDLSLNGFNPFTGRRENGIHLNRRAFFIKFSYFIRREM